MIYNICIFFTFNFFYLTAHIKNWPWFGSGVNNGRMSWTQDCKECKVQNDYLNMGGVVEGECGCPMFRILNLNFSIE